MSLNEIIFLILFKKKYSEKNILKSFLYDHYLCNSYIKDSKTRVQGHVFYLENNLQRPSKETRDKKYASHII